MENPNRMERSFRVVRYHPDFGVGEVEDVLGDHLTMEEAQKLARENPAIVSDEEVVIEEENAPEVDASIQADRI